MAFEVIPNVGGQIERALANYLFLNGVGVWAVKNPGVDIQLLPADSLEVKYYPNIQFFAKESRHDPVQSGNESYTVSITLRWPVATNPNPPNPYGARVARDAVIGAIMGGMMLADASVPGNAPLDATADGITAAGRALATQGNAQEQANNADMAEFTCLNVYFLGSLRGDPNEKGCDWVEVRHFQIEACPSAID